MAKQPSTWQVSRSAVLGGSATACVSLATLYVTGEVAGAEAQYQLEAAQPTVRFLCSTIVTVAATVLALMVTALSLTHARVDDPDPAHFTRLRAIALLCTVALIAGIGVLMLLTVPFGESLEIAGQTYSAFYYLIIGASALLGGVVVTMVLMLHSSLRGMLAMVRPDLREESADA